MADKTAKTLGSVSIPSITYGRKIHSQRRIRAVYGGNKTMKEQTKRFLPKFESEDEATYKRRLMSAHMNNYLEPAINGYVGRIFAKPVILDKEVPQEIKDLWEDIDRQGNLGDMFFQDVVSNGILDGASWVVVDYPSGEPQTLREEKEMNMRPYCRSYADIDVIFVEADESGRIVEFRAIEDVIRRISDDLSQEEKRQIRRFYIQDNTVCWQLYEDNAVVNSGVMSYPAKYGLPIVGYFPTKRRSPTDFFVKPLLMDAADQCIRLWQSISEQDNCLTLARCPFLFASGWTPPDGKDGKISVSPNVSYWSSSPTAHLGWVEHTGSSLQAGKDDIDTLKSDIESAILKPLQSDRQKTAYETQSDDARATSPLKRMADSAKDMIENVLCVMARWIWPEKDHNNDPALSVILNSNLELVSYDATEMTTLMNMVNANLISKSTLLKEAKRRGLLSDELDIDKELMAVSAQDNGIGPEA